MAGGMGAWGQTTRGSGGPSRQLSFVPGTRSRHQACAAPWASILPLPREADGRGLQPWRLQQGQGRGEWAGARPQRLPCRQELDQMGHGVRSPDAGLCGSGSSAPLKAKERGPIAMRCEQTPTSGCQLNVDPAGPRPHGEEGAS